MKPDFVLFVVMLLLASISSAQTFDADRFRELREKGRSGTLTEAERTELEQINKTRVGDGSPADREAMRKKRMEEYAERQDFVFERSRQMQKVALEAAAQRKAPAHEAQVFFVNNETGSDSASGLSAEKAVRTLARAVSLLQPGDTLHLAVTEQPYRETLRLGDDFGGIEGRPVTIEGHGAPLTGSDPLRLDGWAEAGAPGLYRSAKFISELEEFDDAAKLMRVYFIFDGGAQHMGRSSKGAKPRFKSPQDLQPGEWTYVESEKTFYLKVKGTLAEAKVEAPYRRNGVGVRSPKVALTHVVIKDLIVCHVLNDGWNLHGTTRNLLLKNIAAYECGDDGISPHETCEVEIDGFWSIGNSTGMANGNLSVTKARHVHLEGNLAHQFMTGHAPSTELSNAIIIGSASTPPVNVTNAQDTRTLFDNVQIIAPKGQRVLNVANSVITARRVTSQEAGWENAGSIEFEDSRIIGEVTNLPGGTSAGQRDGAGADPAKFRIPPRPVPHPKAGKFTCLQALAAPQAFVRMTGS